MKHPNEAFIDLNIRSPFLNKTEMAKKLNLSPQHFDNKLNGRGRAKFFSTEQLILLEKVVSDDLFGNEVIPLENINPDTI